MRNMTAYYRSFEPDMATRNGKPKLGFALSFQAPFCRRAKSTTESETNRRNHLAWLAVKSVRRIELARMNSGDACGPRVIILRGRRRCIKHAAPGRTTRFVRFRQGQDAPNCSFATSSEETGSLKGRVWKTRSLGSGKN